MIYKDFQELKLSALGMGAMRLPVMAGDDSAIDEAATAEMVAYAMERGINYFLNFPSTDFQIKPEYMWLGIASNRLLYFL